MLSINKKTNRATVTAVIMVIVLVGALLSLLATFGEKTGYREAVIPEQSSSYRQKEGYDETKPTDDTFANYQVAQDNPRVIRIERLGVSARVLSMGINSDNSMQAPINIYDTGWYTGSAKPGKDGALIIDGHVTGPTQKGVFYGLKNLVKDDTIIIERGDGQKFTYRVVTSETVRAENVDMSKLLQVADGKKRGLNLITCDGAFNSSSQQYEKRIIVYAVEL